MPAHLPHQVTCSSPVCEAVTGRQLPNVLWRLLQRAVPSLHREFYVEFIWETLTVMFLVCIFVKRIRILKVVRTSGRVTEFL